jgi:hypothetical protein
LFVNPRIFTIFILVGLLCASLGLAAPHPSPGEVQSHGVLFEDWVRQTFFNHYQPVSYTQKWDIPKEANLQHGGLPVNPKATQYGTPVGLGDALRQFDIDEPFLLIIGYWREEGQNKRYVKVVAPVISPETWRKLWQPITREDLVRLDAVVKDRSLDVREARRQAQAMKSQPPFSEAIITLNPKIDGLGQHRLQCSLSFAKVVKFLAPQTNPAEDPDPRLFGVSLPGPFHSPPRQFTPAAAPPPPTP